jgi:hypothetical protein
MAVAATQISLFEQADRRALTDVLREALRYVPLLGVIGLVVGIHISTMGNYFFGDDFLVLGDVNSQAFPSYMRDVVLLNDLTPNWRPLTMAIYYGEEIGREHVCDPVTRTDIVCRLLLEKKKTNKN